MSQGPPKSQDADVVDSAIRSGRTSFGDSDGISGATSNPHDRGHALGHQLRVGVDDFGLGIGDRPAQVHDPGFADELAAPDRPKEVDLLFDGRGPAVRQQVGEQRVRSGSVGEAVDDAAVHNFGLEVMRLDLQPLPDPSRAGIEELDSEKLQEGLSFHQAPDGLGLRSLLHGWFHTHGRSRFLAGCDLTALRPAPLVRPGARSWLPAMRSMINGPAMFDK